MSCGLYLPEEDSVLLGCDSVSMGNRPPTFRRHIFYVIFKGLGFREEPAVLPGLKLPEVAASLFP